MTSETLEFETRIAESGPAAAIELTEEQAARLSAKKQPPVVVTIGDRSARLRVHRMGGGVRIGLSKASRAQLGVEIGQTVTVRVHEDTAERTVELPSPLADALAIDAAAKARFDALSFTRRKEIAEGIASAGRMPRRRGDSRQRSQSSGAGRPAHGRCQAYPRPTRDDRDMSEPRPLRAFAVAGS